MRVNKLLCHTCLILSLYGFNFAQTPANSEESSTSAKDEKEKARLELEKKAYALVERIAADAATLKIAENRAFLLASAADLLWEQDQKHARSLFQSAATELVAANAEAEKEDSDDQYAMMSFYNSPRRNILQMVARHDADLALELLVQTRSPKLAAEMAKPAAIAGQPAEKPQPTMFGSRMDLKMQAQQELQIEQSFAAQAAEKDPKRAAKLIRESLTKGVSYEALRSVQKLHNRDAELGNTLLAEVVSKVIESDFSRQNSQERMVAGQLLRQFGQQSIAVKEADSKKQSLKLDDKTLRDLANKIADNLVKPSSSALDFTAFYELSSMLPLLEKTIPDRTAQLKQKLSELKKTAPENVRNFGGFNALNNPNAPPEQLIADAAKMPPQMRGMMYRRAADKLAEKGEFERAKQLLSQAPAGKDRDEASAYIDSKLSEKAVKDGKFDEARKIIQTIGTREAQIEQLVKLAVIFFHKNDKESRETAVKIMDEVRGMVDTPPQDETEIQNLLRLISGYAVIETNQAFGLLAPLIDQTNELVQAAALLAKYQKRQFIFREGEMLMMAGIGQMRAGLHFNKEIGLLAAADFERTRDLADKFQRSDVRILVNLLIAQSVLQKTNEKFGNFMSGTVLSVGN